MKNYAFKLMGEAGVRIFSTLFLLILARIVGATNFGVYSSAFAFASLFGILVDLGINPIVTREIARHIDDRKHIVATINVLKVITSVVVMVGLWVVTLWIDWPVEKARLAYWLGWVVVGTAFTEYFNSIFTGLERMGSEAILKVLSKSVVTIAGLVALFQTHDMLTSVQAMALFSVISVVVGAVFTHHRFGSLGFDADWIYIRRLLAQSFPLFGAWAFLILYDSQDILILNYFKVADHDIGLFAMAMKVIDVIKVLPVLMASTFLPSLSRLAHSSPKDFKKRAWKLVRYACISFPPITLLGYICAPLIIQLLYGAGNQAAVPALRLLLIGFLVMAFNFVLLHILIALDKERGSLGATAILCVGNLLASFIWVPSYGILGTCYALIASECLYLITQIMIIQKSSSPSVLHAQEVAPLWVANTPMCSIIIPSYNTRELTLSCLTKIRLFPPPGPYEIIVVDNNSVDGTYDQVRARFPEVLTIRNPENQGFARACNRGAKEAKGSYLLFLNSDTEPQQGTFEKLVEWMQNHPQTGVVGPELVGPGQKLMQMSWSWHPLHGGEFFNRFFAPQNLGLSHFKQQLIRFLQKTPKRVPFVCGACLMIRRDLFKQLSGFDESFELYFEDADLCMRCTEAGWQVNFVPASKIVHHIGQSTRGRWNMSSLIYQQSHITYYRKHASALSTALLKAYLLMKWLRIKLLAMWESEESQKAQLYCRSYLAMISESMHFLLETQFKPIPTTRNEAIDSTLSTSEIASDLSVQKLHLGCGHDIRPGWINLDSANLPGVNVVHDIENIPWPFETGSIDRITAHQLLEHVEYIPVLREAHRILKKGGVFDIAVPHFTSRNNWVDPTHKKTFSIRTFEFFVQHSRFDRDYYFDFAYTRIRRQRLVFEKNWLLYNFLVEPLVNLHPKIAVLYEATFLRSLFPAESVAIELEK